MDIYRVGRATARRRRECKGRGLPDDRQTQILSGAHGVSREADLFHRLMMRYLSAERAANEPRRCWWRRRRGGTAGTVMVLEMDDAALRDRLERSV